MADCQVQSLTIMWVLGLHIASDLPLTEGFSASFLLPQAVGRTGEVGPSSPTLVCTVLGPASQPSPVA